MQKVNWYHAIAFCNKLSLSEGLTPVYMGSNALANHSVYGEDSGLNDTNAEPRTTRPVGSKLTNELGLYDMSGNGWEWCWDWYDAYPSGELTDYEFGFGWCAPEFCSIAGSRG